jgi:hypothetical protein
VHPRRAIFLTERAEHIAEWIRLTEERENPAQLAPGFPPKAGHVRQQGGINAATRELGIERFLGSVSV